MAKLYEAMEKVLAGREASARSRRSASRQREGLTRAAGEPLVDPAQVPTIGWAADRLLRGKIVAQLMDGQRAWAGQRRAVEALRMVRTQTLHALEAGGPAGSVAITSPRQGDGKTLVSINLAMGVARQTQRKVLLVDADLRRPSIARTLGLTVEHGLSDYLAGDAPLEACLMKSSDERLFVIPQRRPLPHSSELLANGVLASLTEMVRRRYTDWLVVLDCPPILAIDDTHVILRVVDKALLIVREGQTRRGEMRRAAEAIGREKYLGAVLNDSRTRGDTGRYYYYDYGYESR